MHKGIARSTVVGKQEEPCACGRSADISTARFCMVMRSTATGGRDWASQSTICRAVSELRTRRSCVRTLLGAPTKTKG